MPSVTDETIIDAIVDDLQDYKGAGTAQLEGLTHGGIGSIKSDTDEKTIIYEATTGEARSIPLVYLAKTLKKRHPLTGEAVFVPHNPKTGQPYTPVPEYRTGTLMCFLHPNHPERDDLETMGISRDIVCGNNETAPAGSFRSEFDLRLHEQKRHKHSWAMREHALERRRDEETRAEQRKYTEAILKLAASGVAARELHVCDVETCDRFFDNPLALASHKKVDHK